MSLNYSNQVLSEPGIQTNLPINFYNDLTKDIGVINPGKVILLYGNPMVYNVGLYAIEKILGHSDLIAIVDGANRFDLYGLTRLAQINKIDPWNLLDRIFLSRIFTGYQLDAVIRHGLLPLLKKVGSRVAFVLGLLHTLFDDQMPVREAIASLVRIRKKFESLKDEGISVVLISEHILPQQQNRRPLINKMMEMLDIMYFSDGETMCQINPCSDIIKRKILYSSNIKLN